MQSLQSYPDYCESGIAWVGKIPSHWQVKPTFAVADEESIKNTDGKETTVLSLSYGRVIIRDVEQNFGLLPDSFDTYQLVFSDDIILRLTDLQNDKRSLRVGLSTHQGIITSAYLKLVCKRKELLPIYAFMLLHSYDTTKVFYGMGGGLRQSMKFSDFRRLPLLIPPIAEQIQIAAFLDRETAKIDLLIEKQHRLIELLKEKRQAVISQAVTKGLNVEVPMKDSGIEWLGKVPEHWQSAPIRRCITDHKQGYYTTDEYSEDGVKLLRITDLEGNGEASYLNCPRVPDSPNLRDFMLELNDVVFARTGGAGLFGVVSDLSEDVVYASYLIRFRFKQTVFETSFLRYSLLSEAFQLSLKQNIHGGVNQNIHAEDVKNVVIAIPPMDEQERISNYLDTKITKVELIIKNTELAIKLMRERRTSLINAAVTGKIDVQGQVPQDVG